MNEYHLSRTISAMLGKGNQNHNSRKFIANNVDPSRTSQNIEYINMNIHTAYYRLFDEALQRYNAKQKRKDRVIKDYYNKIRTSKQEKTFHEVIIQIGNCEDTNARSPEGELAKIILDEYMKNFQKEIHHYLSFRHICTWTKKLRIFILISYLLSPIVSVV